MHAAKSASSPCPLPAQGSAAQKIAAARQERSQLTSYPESHPTFSSGVSLRPPSASASSVKRLPPPSKPPSTISPLEPWITKNGCGLIACSPTRRSGQQCGRATGARVEACMHGAQVIPTPLHVLDRISPIFSPFFPVFCAFSPSRRGGSNEPKTGTQGHETVSRAPRHRFSGLANSGCWERMEANLRKLVRRIAGRRREGRGRVPGDGLQLLGVLSGRLRQVRRVHAVRAASVRNDSLVLCTDACASADLVQGWLLISRWLRNAGSTPGTRRPRHPRLRWPTAAGTTSPRARSAQTTGRRSGRTAAPGAETRERARPSFSVPLASRRPPQLPEVVWAAVARHMLYGPGLLAAGWNNSDASPTPNSRIEGNAAAARKAMDALTTRCCGC